MSLTQVHAIVPACTALGSPELHKRISQNRQAAVAKLEKGRKAAVAKLEKYKKERRLKKAQRLKRALQQQRARAARLQLLANREEVQLEIELEDAERVRERQWGGVTDSDGGADKNDWEADAVEEHLAFLAANALQQAAQAENSTP